MGLLKDIEQRAFNGPPPDWNNEDDFPPITFIRSKDDSVLTMWQNGNVAACWDEAEGHRISTFYGWTLTVEQARAIGAAT